jgi:hypothetical protein
MISQEMKENIYVFCLETHHHFFGYRKAKAHAKKPNKKLPKWPSSKETAINN